MNRVATAPPTLPRDRYRWPRRALYVVVLLGAGAFLVYAFRQAPDPMDERPHDPAIVRQTPIPGSHVQPTETVGILLKPGFDGRLVVDGTSIPEGQMDGAIPPGSPEFDPQLGARPNTKNEVMFTPGPSKVIKALRPGQAMISVRYWNIASGERTAKIISWEVSVG